MPRLAVDRLQLPVLTWRYQVLPDGPQHLIFKQCSNGVRQDHQQYPAGSRTSPCRGWVSARTREGWRLPWWEAVAGGSTSSSRVCASRSTLRLPLQSRRLQNLHGSEQSVSKVSFVQMLHRSHTLSAVLMAHTEAPKAEFAIREGMT